VVNAMRTSYLRLTRTTLWICLLSGAVTFFDLQLAKAKSIDGWDVYGMHGEMTVQGSLTEPACVLAMESKDQSIDLGITSRVSLNRIGNRTDPVTVHFQLKDCGVVGNSPRDDSHGGNITFLPGQLVSYVTVSGVASDSNKYLMKVSGSAGGVGLRLEDYKHRQLIPGEHSEPLIMSQGNTDLVMYAMLERIPEELIEGEYHTTINLNLTYQ